MPARSVSWASSGENGADRLMRTVDGSTTSTLADRRQLAAPDRAGHRLVPLQAELDRLGVELLAVVELHAVAQLDRQRLAVGRPLPATVASCGTMFSFSSMSNSLSHSAANTMRPTKVRASVGSSTSGSSARPMRRVCAERRRRVRGCGQRPARCRRGGSRMSSFEGSPQVTRNAACSRSNRASGSDATSDAPAPAGAASSRQKWQATAWPSPATSSGGRRCGSAAARAGSACGSGSPAAGRSGWARRPASSDARSRRARLRAPGSPTAAPGCRGAAAAQNSARCRPARRSGPGTSPRPAWRCAAPRPGRAR